MVDFVRYRGNTLFCVSAFAQHANLGRRGRGGGRLKRKGGGQMGQI